MEWRRETSESHSQLVVLLPFAPPYTFDSLRHSQRLQKPLHFDYTAPATLNPRPKLGDDAAQLHSALCFLQALKVRENLKTR